MKTELETLVRSLTMDHKLELHGRPAVNDARCRGQPSDSCVTGMCVSKADRNFTEQ